LLKVQGKFVECPICDIKGNIGIKGDKIRIIFDEEQLQKSRWGEWGDKRHLAAIMRYHQEYEEKKQEIKERLQKYKAHKRDRRGTWSKRLHFTVACQLEMRMEFTR